MSGAWGGFVTVWRSLAALHGGCFTEVLRVKHCGVLASHCVKSCDTVGNRRVNNGQPVARDWQTMAEAGAVAVQVLLPFKAFLRGKVAVDGLPQTDEGALDLRFAFFTRS